MTHKQRILSMLNEGKSDRLPFMPITMMFAADRIGRPYRDYATDHRVMAEAQLRVAEQFDFDYVSVISDPAREAADCGATVLFPPDAPPAIDENQALLADTTTLTSLKAPAPHAGRRMADRIQGVELLAKSVGQTHIVEGWIEGPCAEAADLRGINHLMLDFYDDAKFVTDLLAFVFDLELAFAKAQIQAGATLIGIGDAAASLIGPDLYEQFIFPAEKLLIDHLHNLNTLVRLHICGNTTAILPKLAELNADILDLDYPVSLAEARKLMPANQVLLGNIDPVRTLRHGTPDSVYAAVGKCHLAAGPHYIVAAGCEIPRDTHPDNVLAMRRYAREH